MFLNFDADKDMTGEGQPQVTNATPQVVTTEDQTKAYSERLKKDREKIRKEALDEQAQALGYKDNSEYMEYMTNKKIIDKGYDPEELKPVIKDLIASDPEYKEAMKYKKEREVLEQDSWSKLEVEKLNKKFGTTFTSIKDLSPDVVKHWNAGMPLEKAYAAENIDSITESISKKTLLNGKTHMTPPPSAGNPNGVADREPTAEEIKRFRQINGSGVTVEQIKKFINKK